MSSAYSYNHYTKTGQVETSIEEEARGRRIWGREALRIVSPETNLPRRSPELKPACTDHKLKLSVSLSNTDIKEDLKKMVGREDFHLIPVSRLFENWSNLLNHQLIASEEHKDYFSTSNLLSHSMLNLNAMPILYEFLIQAVFLDCMHVKKQGRKVCTVDELIQVITPKGRGPHR
ncbi:hypothetical protein YC2023_083029 [Brassica napus]